ncbi:hypothetical protein F0562_015877 [Nyssa sinensis]|uniref:Leucine-rich repeat-containing N-terminal plant-type domain-containing protein n=1 Tax=Nyssa sinensis TaxID=561372 RepID=A0A5J4ZI38_9ASTE|nr:hypothetical protein F0562_015877 [Nyssa sinensis]
MVLAKNRFSRSLLALNMPSLIFLDVNTNMLSGELPAEICNALSLANLLLSDNNFTGTIKDIFRKGKIPHRLWDSKTLVKISLSSSLLEGQILVSCKSLHPAEVTTGQTSSSSVLLNEKPSGSQTFSQSPMWVDPLDNLRSMMRSLAKLNLSNNLLTGPLHSGPQLFL